VDTNDHASAHGRRTWSGHGPHTPGLEESADWKIVQGAVLASDAVVSRHDRNMMHAIVQGFAVTIDGSAEVVCPAA
jgi:hypothetical protein